MSQAHLIDLIKSLASSKWVVLEETNGNDLDVSAYWLIANNRYPTINLLIAFDGMSDEMVLPIEQSYGCFLVPEKAISVYFSRKMNVNWKIAISEFVEKLNKYATRNPP